MNRDPNGLRDAGSFIKSWDESGEAALPRPEVSEEWEKHECGLSEPWKGQQGPGDTAPSGSWWEVDFLL